MGLGAFWDNLEGAKSASDALNVSNENIRKRSLRSVERNILNVINEIDESEYL